MTGRTFEAPAKWILAGEHSVLRGFQSVGLPHTDFQLKITYTPGDTLVIEPETLQSLVRNLLTLSADYLNHPELNNLTGRLEFSSDIPECGGLGSSAALCVALSKFILNQSEKQFQDDSQNQILLNLATRLEDRFHGCSSGMDVAVVGYSAPIIFQKGKRVRKLDLKRIPKFRFHDTGERGSTKECIRIVEALHSRNPEHGSRVDQKMAAACLVAETGLLEYSESQFDEGLRHIAEAMTLGHECFTDWGLSSEAIERQRKSILESGALAVKLTGAGKGGFLVSLWE